MTQLDKVRIISRKKIADHRGWFLKTIDGHEEGLPEHTGETYLTCGGGGQFKGGHYHPKAQEWFILIAGAATLVLEDIVAKQKLEIELNAEEPRTIFIPPYVAHKIINTSDTENFILLAYTDLLYDPSDTIVYEIEYKK